MIRVECLLLDAVGTLLFAQPGVIDVYVGTARKVVADASDWNEQAIQQALRYEEIKRRFLAAYDQGFDGRGPCDEVSDWSLWRHVVTLTFAGLVPDPCVEVIFDRLWEYFARPQSWQLFDDAILLLDSLRERGVPHAIASNFDRRLKSICQSIPQLRDVPCFFSTDLGFAKPSRDFFRAIEERLELEGERLLMVGDDPARDFDAPLASGWQAVLLDREAAHLDRSPRISSLTEVMDWLDDESA